MSGSQFTIAQIVNPKGPAEESSRVESRTFTLEQVVAPRGAAEVAIRIDNVVIVDSEDVPVTA
jgi:hypothetical protein